MIVECEPTLIQSVTGEGHVEREAGAGAIRSRARTHLLTQNLNPIGELSLTPLSAGFDLV